MTAAEPRAHRDPIMDPPRKKKKGLSTGALVGITMSVIVHLLAGMWLYNEKFKLQVFDYNDDAVDVEIVEPLPPPPPPPPPDTPPPPPKLQIRPPVINTDAPPPPVTLQIVATKKEDRVEYTGPPVIVPGPPPPPAPAPPPRPPVITNPSWSSRPAGEFPERALSRGIESGVVQLECTVNANGSVSGCTILSESPSGSGFGQAAISGARRARLTPRSVDGVAVGGRVRFTTRFALAD